MVEFWQLVTDPVWNEDYFGCETGADLLRRHFAHVERREAVTEAMWETKEAAQMFLDAFVEMVGPLTAPDGPYPLKATRRLRVCRRVV